MFGSSNLSGQSSSSNPLAPKPFSTSPGLFRAPQVSSPFGASSQGFVSSTPVFRPSAFGSSDSPCGRTPAFGFSTPQPSPSVSTTQQSQKNTFGAFNTSTSTPSFSFGSSSAFGQSNSPFGSQQVGSRVKTYALTVEAEQDGGTKSAMKLGSLSAMPVYKHKSHEELRWEDYQRGDKGGQSPFFAATSPNPTNNFSSTTATTLFAPTTTSKSSSPFGPTTTNVFGPSPSFTVTPSRSFFASSTIASAPANASTQAFSSGFSFNNSHSSALFSSNPSMRQTRSAFEQNTTPAYNFTTPSTGSKNLFSSSSSLYTSTSPFVQTTPANLTPNQSAQPSDGYGQVPASFNSVVTQIAPVTNPFGTLPALPQFPIQYGISSMPAPARISPLLTSRNLLQRRVRPSVRKCRPGDDDAPKVTFFSDTLKSSAPFIPRENPRALFIQDWRRR